MIGSCQSFHYIPKTLFLWFQTPLGIFGLSKNWNTDGPKIGGLWLSATVGREVCLSLPCNYSCHLVKVVRLNIYQSVSYGTSPENDYFTQFNGGWGLFAVELPTQDQKISWACVSVGSTHADNGWSDFGSRTKQSRQLRHTPSGIDMNVISREGERAHRLVWSMVISDHIFDLNKNEGQIQDGNW